MTEVFGSHYSDAYDAFYRDKDYGAECTLVETLAAQQGVTDAMRILDLGCGTAQHAVVLAARGHDVVGVDLSVHMLDGARRRAAAANVSNLRLLQGDVRSLRLGSEFDMVLLMFAVLGYQVTDEDVRETFETARTHLRPGGLLIFDVWNGPAVEKIGPSQRVRTIPLDGMDLIRRAAGTLDVDKHVCTVDYELEWKAGKTQLQRDRERHQMRYFFESELRVLARDAGLAITSVSAFPDVHLPADETQWNAIYTATAT